MTSSRQPLNAVEFGRYVTRRARGAGYDLTTTAGRTKLAKDTGMPERDVTAIAEGRFKAPADPWKTLAEKLGEQHKDLLRIAGILKPGSRPTKKTSRDTALDLGITSPKNVAIFEALVTALLNAEK
ncbi:hypothetical protein ACIPJS_14280 [Streptomyces sp. NPDC086783]|uniref:hypothetical protein n=1 Tax=Streptomyces sp. NPDC086783 TaxID=3365758 RepID=UPI00381E6AE5